MLLFSRVYIVFKVTRVKKSVYTTSERYIRVYTIMKEEQYRGAYAYTILRGRNHGAQVGDGIARSTRPTAVVVYIMVVRAEL